MEKIRNFGQVVFNRNKNQIEYSYFIKDNNNHWVKKHEQKTIYNQVYIPNVEAVLKTRFGKSGGLVKDLWGNEILVGVPCEFYEKNPPDIVKNAGPSFSSDISPVVKFLSENFEFDPENDELPPLKTLYIDIETHMDDGGFLDAWGAACSRGGIKLISCYDTTSNKVVSFGIKQINKEEWKDYNITNDYIFCQDERILLKNFVKYLKNSDPDIISGWNVSNYDIPYILNRLVYCFGEKALRHFGNSNAWLKNEARRFIITGMSVVDYMIIYKKFELTPRRSYTLSNIMEEENIKIDGKGKHTYEGSLRDLSENDWDSFVKYCIQDTCLVSSLDDKKKLMETFIMLCYMAGISFDKAIAQDISWLRIHDAAIYRYCKEKGMELPTAVKVGYGEEENTFTGAYVKTPVPDLYDYVTVFDVASLYPSCIRSLNISIDSYRGKIKSISGKPIKEAFDKNFNLIKGAYEVEFYDPLHLSLKDFEQTLIQRANNKLKNKIDPNIGKPKKMIFDHGDNFLSYLKVNKLCVGANGTIFTTERRGVIPSLLDSWIAIRKKNKNLYFEYKKKHQETGDIQYKKLSERYKTIQDVYKIRLNSLYGFIGTKYSRFFNVDLSEAVTLTGQLILKSTEAALKNANVFFDALYCDTDSIFIHYGKILKVRGIDLNDKEACVATCKQIDIEVKTVIDNHLNMITGSIMNTPNYYSFESEEIYEKLLITSKKKYVAKTLYDKVNNAFVTNDYNIKGMDFKKSNLSKPIKDLLRNITIKIMDGMTESEVLAHFKDIWNKIPEFPIDDIAFAQKVDGLGKYGVDTIIEFNSPTNANVVFPLHCPYHVAGALALNALIDFDDDLHDMTKAVNGDKAKIIFVTPKNIMTVESVTYVGKWNPKLYDYFKLDIEKIFLRTILQPMQPVLDAMKFKITLDSILGFKFTDSENTVQQLLLF